MIDDLEYQQGVLLEAFRAMPEDEQEALVRVAHYLASYPEQSKFTFVDVEALLGAPKQMH